MGGKRQFGDRYVEGNIILKWTMYILHVKIFRLHLHGLGERETRVDVGLNAAIQAYITFMRKLKALLKK